jgi:hypothetical protein
MLVACQGNLFAVDGELHESDIVEISEVAICSENVQNILQRRLARFDSLGNSNAVQLLSAEKQLDGFSNNFVISASKQQPAYRESTMGESDNIIAKGRQGDESHM